MMKMKTRICLLALLAHSTASLAQTTARIVPKDAAAFLQTHCIECHGAKTAKGDLRLDNLPTDFAETANASTWTDVLDNIHSGDMPPKKVLKRPTAAEITPITDWLSGSLQAAEQAAQSREGSVVMRRLNRMEYQNTVPDLFGFQPGGYCWER